ncbi:MAG: hypothetical protein IRY87_15940 [Acetobacteraceae bacterium]|nr:hypothetical protein [Acetobacteraceae bacterium]
MALEFVQITATIAGFVCIALARLHLIGRRIADDWATLGVIAPAAQCSLIVTAIIEIALPRYFFPVWPFYWITIVYLARFAYEWASRKGARKLLVVGQPC